MMWQALTQLISPIYSLSLRYEGRVNRNRKLQQIIKGVESIRAVTNLIEIAHNLYSNQHGN